MKGSKVGALLARDAKVERAATSVKLGQRNLEGAKGFCESRGITVSELLDALLGDFLDAQQPTPQRARGRPAKGSGS